MKKTILVGLIMVIMGAIPGFAQEIEPDGIFSLHGTKWKILPIGVRIFPFPSLWRIPPDQVSESGSSLGGFYGGKVYPAPDYVSPEKSFYLDMLVASIFMYQSESYISGPPGSEGYTISSTTFGILQPTGIGIVTIYGHNEGGPPPHNSLIMMFVVKNDNNWEPPDDMLMME